MVIRKLKLTPECFVMMCSEHGPWTTAGSRLPEDAVCEGVEYHDSPPTITLLIGSSVFRPDDPEELNPILFVRHTCRPIR